MNFSEVAQIVAQPLRLRVELKSCPICRMVVNSMSIEYRLSSLNGCGSLSVILSIQFADPIHTVAEPARKDSIGQVLHPSGGIREAQGRV